MKRNKRKITSILLIILTLISIQINSYSHSGRTDSSGGHKDNNNESGLGNYHYHCGGHPAHLHTNGVCPYSSTPEPTTVDATGIQINEKINSINVGESKKITAIITPYDATNKNITWKSSDESVATISSSGEIIAKQTGFTNITASTYNGKTSTIKLEVKEEAKIENNLTVNNLEINQNMSINNTTESANNQENSNLLGGVLTLGILGGGGYWGYKKYNKSK